VDALHGWPLMLDIMLVIIGVPFLFVLAALFTETL
jgi:hypothetical protein